MPSISSELLQFIFHNSALIFLILSFLLFMLNKYEKIQIFISIFVLLCLTLVEFFDKNHPGFLDSNLDYKTLTTIFLYLGTIFLIFWNYISHKIFNINYLIRLSISIWAINTNILFELIIILMLLPTFSTRFTLIQKNIQASKEAIKNYFNDLNLFPFLIIMIALFCGGTGSLDFSNITIQNYMLYKIFLVFYVIVFCFFIFEAPFSFPRLALFLNSNSIDTLANLLYLKFTALYIFLNSSRYLFSFVQVDDLQIYLNYLSLFFIVSMLFLSVFLLTTKNDYKKVVYLFVLKLNLVFFTMMGFSEVIDIEFQIGYLVETTLAFSLFLGLSSLRPRINKKLNFIEVFLWSLVLLYAVNLPGSYSAKLNSIIMSYFLNFNFLWVTLLGIIYIIILINLSLTVYNSLRKIAKNEKKTLLS